MTLEERIKSMTKRERLEYAIREALMKCNSKFKIKGKITEISGIENISVVSLKGYDSNGNDIDDSNLELCASADFKVSANLSIKVNENDSQNEYYSNISSSFIKVKYSDDNFSGEIDENVSVI